MKLVSSEYHGTSLMRSQHWFRWWFVPLGNMSLPEPMLTQIYRQTSNISRTLVSNKIGDHSDVVGASPHGLAALLQLNLHSRLNPFEVMAPHG